MKLTFDDLYSIYGFKKKTSSKNGVSVYTYDTGYFHNADIVTTEENFQEAEEIKEKFENSGYSSQIKTYATIAAAESALFDGFFAVATTKSHHAEQYQEYRKKHLATVGVPYEYIPSYYSEPGVDNEKKSNLVERVVGLLQVPGPQLIVIEAAAGFGKTTTVYELLNRMASSTSEKLPFLAELSKNRQAQIFKYVLLDEINRQFPTLNLDLINYQVKHGNVVLIVDGFDELLRKSDSSSEVELHESTEPMLETISHLLKDNAKVILTTRKTALFSGDSFHAWMEMHSAEFSVSRFSLFEPDTEMWIGSGKIQRLLAAGFDLSVVPNPVLLSWIRGMDEEKFSKICSNTEQLIDGYFTQLLEREKGRQDLPASPEEQMAVFKGLAQNLVNIDATSESKEIIEQYLLNDEKDLVKLLRQRYPVESRPTEEQIIEKLSLHALLDRKGNGTVGFVNDFVFGFFIGESAIELNDKEWMANDERFPEYAVSAFRNRDASAKERLWEIFNFYIELLSPRGKFNADYYLKGCIHRDYVDENFSEMSFDNVTFGKDFIIKTSAFSDCTFSNCNFNFENLKQVYFVGCRFYSCHAEGRGTLDCFFGCDFNESTGFDTFSDDTSPSLLEHDEWEFHVLSKIWPPGAARFAIHRAVQTTKSGISINLIPYVEAALESLTRKNLISIENQVITVNMKMLADIKKILGRG